MGISPLHASTVGLTLNPNTNRLSPQFHCVYDDHFETTHSKFDSQPPDVWGKLVINSRFRNDLEHDVEDTWETPILKSPAILEEPKSAEVPLKAIVPQHVNVPVTENAASDKMSVPTSPPKSVAPMEKPNPTITETVPPVTSEPPLRRSIRTKNPIERFVPGKAAGYSSIKRYASTIIKCLMLCSVTSRMSPSVCDMHYATALAMDP